MMKHSKDLKPAFEGLFFKPVQRPIINPWSAFSRPEKTNLIVSKTHSLTSFINDLCYVFFYLFCNDLFTTRMS